MNRLKCPPTRSVLSVSRHGDPGCEISHEPFRHSMPNLSDLKKLLTTWTLESLGHFICRYWPLQALTFRKRCSLGSSCSDKNTVAPKNRASKIEVRMKEKIILNLKVRGTHLAKVSGIVSVSIRRHSGGGQWREKEKHAAAGRGSEWCNRARRSQTLYSLKQFVLD